MRKFLFAIILFAAGNAYAQSNQELRDSLSVISQQLNRQPKDIDLRLRKAGLNVQLEQWDYALREYDTVLWLDKNNVSALYFRAYVNEKLRRYNFARADYQNLLAIIPGHFEGRLGLALLNQKDKRYTEAMDLLNALCQAAPNRAEAFAARAGVEQERGMLELAEFDYGEAVRIEPQNIDYRLARADIRLRLNHFEDARNDLDTLVRQGVSRASLEDFYKKLR